MIWLIAAAGLLAFLLVPPSPDSLLKRLKTTPAAAKSSRHWWYGLAALPLVAWGLWSGVGAFAVAMALLGGALAYQFWRRRQDRRELALAGEIARGCRIMAALLSQGYVPQQALITTAEECPVLAPAAAVAQMGGDVPPVLLSLSQKRGAQGLAEVARAWQITAASGAGLLAVLERVRDALSRQVDLAAIIAQEVAGPRASAQLLAVLPLAGLAVGGLIGGDPLGFLSGTLPGRACLMIGVGLMAVGMLWSDVLTRQPSPGEQRRSR